VKEELGELLRNWPWIMLLVASVSPRLSSPCARKHDLLFQICRGATTTVRLFEIFNLKFDRTRSSVHGHAGTDCRHGGAGLCVRKLDKKNAAVILCTITA